MDKLPINPLSKEQRKKLNKVGTQVGKKIMNIPVEIPIHQTTKLKGTEGAILHMTFHVKGTLNILEQRLREHAQKGEYDRFNECLGEWFKFKIFETLGLKKYPITKKGTRTVEVD